MVLVLWTMWSGACWRALSGPRQLGHQTHSKEAFIQPRGIRIHVHIAQYDSLSGDQWYTSEQCYTLSSALPHLTIIIVFNGQYL